MLNTYKLDKYGLPYKVGSFRTEKTLKKEETGKPVSADCRQKVQLQEEKLDLF